MKKTYGFFMTETGRLPDAIRNRLAEELPQFAGKRVVFTFETYDKEDTVENTVDR